jgi:hypothetical protein
MKYFQQDDQCCYLSKTYQRMKYLLIVLSFAGSLQAQELYRFPSNTTTGWSSFENPNSVKGEGGKENKNAKGHAFNMIKPGEKVVLLDVAGAGTIQRMWMTLNERTPRVLRSVRLDIYWEGETEAAVSAPLGDFFGIGLGRTAIFQNALFSNPEGRSFNSNIPMPFRKHAKVVLTNESDKSIMFFYDINFLRVEKHPADMLYFHAHWNNNTGTKLGEDFAILPKVSGRGRFIGTNLGMIADTVYGNSWFGEGEVRMFIDGDKNHPSLVGTGTEDYIGTGWGQGAYAQLYQGCPIADTAKKQYTFYRYHIPDPVYFSKDIKVVIQQMGGDMTNNVQRYFKAGAKLMPVTVATTKEFYKLFEMNPVPDLMDKNFPFGWTNFYRLDNYSATAYFYLDKPINGLAPLASVKERVKGLPE